MIAPPSSSRWRRRRGPQASADPGSYPTLYTQVHEAVQAADGKSAARVRADWEAWLTSGISSGAKRVRMLLRDPTPWAAGSALSADGRIVTDP
eukprot:822098-Pyramimonas_sp.AAC.1